MSPIPNTSESVLKRILFVGWMIVSIGAGTVRVYGGDEPADALRPTNIERRIWRIKVVDNTDHHPIADVVIRPQGLRVAGPTNIAEWSRDAWGPMPRSVTNKDGVALVEMPRYLAGCSGMPHQEIAGFIFRCDHADFATDNFACGLRFGGKEFDGSAWLYRARKIRVGAYADDPSILLDRVFAVVNFPLANVGWKKSPDGLFQSTGFYPGSRRCWIVQLPENGPAQFSLPLALPEHHDGDDPVELVTKVSPGVRVAGTLDDSIPRPVVNGRVLASVRVPPDKESDRPEFSQLCWEEWTNIRSDGTFEFPSLPRFADLELLAYCDGFVSVPVDSDQYLIAAGRYGAEPQIDESLNYPQLFRLRTQTLKPVIPMEPAASCVWTFVDEQGAAVSGVKIRANLGIGGIGQSEMATYQNQRGTGEWLQDPWSDIEKYQEMTRRFEATSNRSGEAMIQNLPARIRSLNVEAPGRFVHADSQESLFSIQLTSGKTERVTVILSSSTNPVK
ncbi:MAG: hypothetical protein JSS49_04330 [Planctomycetes bacterium]|nr:hypothetical protein [Planctomycetota bacterium]